MAQQPTQPTIDQRIGNIEEALGKLIDIVGDQGKKLEAAGKTTTKSKGLFGGKREHVAVLDTKTNIVYPSKARLARAVASELGLDPLNHFTPYKMYTAAPGRFKDLTPDAPEAKAAWEKEKAEIQAQVDAANKKLAEEEAAKAKAEADAKTAADAKLKAEAEEKVLAEAKAKQQASNRNQNQQKK